MAAYKNCRNCGAAPDVSFDKCSYCGMLKAFEPLPVPVVKTAGSDAHKYGMPPVNLGGMSPATKALLIVGGIGAAAYVLSSRKRRPMRKTKGSLIWAIILCVILPVFIYYFLKSKHKRQCEE